VLDHAAEGATTRGFRVSRSDAELKPPIRATLRHAVRVGELVACLGHDLYVVWSDTVDAPPSPVLSRAAMTEHLVHRNAVGRANVDGLMARVDANGTSADGVAVADLIAVNRAGAGERHLTLEEILVAYR
jgi:hypothetical protein